MRVLLLTLLLFTSACSYLRSPPVEPTLSDLQPARLPASESELPSVDLAQLAEVYRQVLEVSGDHQTRLLVLQRLADIEMLQAEEALVDNGMSQQLFDEAIRSYRGLLEENPGVAGNDRLLYQLSRAYDMTGDSADAVAALEQLSTDYPQSSHYVEAQFRVAENYFVEANYAAAERAYQQVISAGDASPHYRNALYMHGWSQFKQGEYRPAIRSYTETLDLLMPGDNELDVLSAGDRALVEDCFRVLAVIFSYLEGVETIAAAYEALGERSYQPLLYAQLGELYLKQERFRDSAETFRAFSRRYPDSLYAHRFHVRVIGIYEDAGFRDLIVTEKRDYVASYGISEDYWLNSEAEVQQEISENLKLFIDELATHYHALAQAEAGAEEASGDAAQYYLLAGDYYQLYIDSFSDDPRVPEMGFLLAESRSEAGMMVEAISAYEWVAYSYPDFAQAADAGYAAIIGYDSLLAPEQGERRLLLQERKVDSQLRYAATFTADARAPAVLNDAAASALELSDYSLAIIAAATLARWQPAPPDSLLIPAWLVIAHSYFELQNYPEAGQGYRRALTDMPRTDERRDGTVERLAASLYREAEITAQSEDYQLAAQQFARVLVETPDTEIRLQAQFDAAANYMLAEDYEQANRLLMDFRQRFAGHPLVEQVPLKLVYNYEQLEQWQLAAAELDSLLPSEKDSERAREMLYLSAEYYDRAGNSELALQRYRNYAHEWEQPLAPRLEAMNRLSEIYLDWNEADKRRFWLRKIMAAHAAAGSAQTERSLYLAAQASSVFADDQYQAFEGLPLQAPLKRSLKRKNAAMQKALAAYQKTNAYGVADFSSLATFRMGDIYQQLSLDLIDSERPRGLDELALEQYELLLEEQAYPFEEKAIAIHETNARRSWEGWYDPWIKQSFTALAQLSPGRYAKTELTVSFSEEIY
ncbi:MAG: tetratricopeptide repeat protein [Halieaceae bacterium]